MKQCRKCGSEYGRRCGKCHKEDCKRRNQERKSLTRDQRILECANCHERKPLSEMSGNYFWCKSCCEARRYRVCKHCGERKPFESFARNQSICQTCQSIPKPEKPPKPITHRITDNGITENLCRKCKEWKPETDFYNDGESPDGKNTACKSCAYKKPAWNGRTKFADITDGHDKRIVKIAKSKWKGMHRRCQEKGCYANVQIQVTKEDFLRWVIPEIEEFYANNPYEVASVDRINSAGHYELGNMRVISHRENSRLGALSGVAKRKAAKEAAYNISV